MNIKKTLVLSVAILVGLVVGWKIFGWYQEQKVDDVFRLNAKLTVDDLMNLYTKYLNSEINDFDELKVEALETFVTFGKKYDPTEVDLTDKEAIIAGTIADLNIYIITDNKEKVMETYEKLKKMLEK